MKNEYKILITLICCIFFSCVSSDQYKELLEVKGYLEQENETLRGMEKENRNLRSEKRKSNVQLDKAQQEIVELQAAFASLDRNYKDLANRYNGLISDNRKIDDLSVTEKQFLQEKLAKKQIELEQKERQLQFMENSLSQKEQKIQELSRLLEAKNAQMRGN